MLLSVSASVALVKIPSAYVATVKCHSANVASANVISAKDALPSKPPDETKMESKVMCDLGVCNQAQRALQLTIKDFEKVPPGQRCDAKTRYTP